MVPTNDVVKKDKSKETNTIPDNYVRLEGSERRPSPRARLLGAADPHEHFSVTIVLRRSPDGEPIPDFDFYLKTPPGARPHLSEEEFAQKYGAAAEDLKKVKDFATKNGLKVEEANVARRSVVVSGTVDQMSKAFGVTLSRYEHEVVRGRGEKPRTETYRGRDGFIHVPKNLEGIIVGVFGLDNRRITRRSVNGDPPNTTNLAIEEITKLYNFPTNSASGQTIGIFSEAGYRSSDINQSFGGSPPTITSIPVDASNDGSADVETTQDIVIAAKAAPGSSIVVYFTTYTQQGWFDLIEKVAVPPAGWPYCSVLSSSFYVSNGDDSATLTGEGISTSWLNAVTQALQDAAIHDVTVCVASGDTGTDSKVRDCKAHVQYPASDPWVLSVGGTTIGNVSGSKFDEYVWNDSSGATGGGVSDYFALPSYQTSAWVPKSINDNTHVGRGVPDVAANASGNAGYTGITVGGRSFVGGGTSASAPLWAGLIAVINAALPAAGLGVRNSVGFVNPVLYAIGSIGFNDITGAAGPTNNGSGCTPGYPARVGWDACTGWGSPNGTALLNALRDHYGIPITPITCTGPVQKRCPGAEPMCPSTRGPTEPCPTTRFPA